MFSYYRKSYDIAGYTFRVEILCPACTVESAIGAGIMSPGARGMDVEEALAQAAEYVGIEDRMDKRSFDSGDFPKVIFVSQLEEDEVCHSCGGEL